MQTGKTHLFGVLVAKVQLPGSDALKQQFLPEMLRRYQARAYQKPALWETDRVHTSYAAGKEAQVINGIDSMPEAYDRLLREFLKAARFNVRLWHSVYWTGQEYEQQHHYLPSHLSFLHCLAFDATEHKPPVFFDPARTMKAYCRHPALPPECWEDKTAIDVREGDVLVFPSYLEHHISPGTYSTPLVTVSMNVTLAASSG